MSSWGLYFIFLIPPLVLGFVIQHWLKKTVAANMQVEVTNGLTGAEVARQILDRNGLQNVPVETSPGGPLSDHYDPRKKSVHLSEPVYGGRAVASTAIAAHEVGHAIQHAKAYAPFRLRSAMWPAVAFAQIAHLGNARSRGPVLRLERALANPYALAGAGLALLLQLAAATIEPLARILRVAPLDAVEWMVVVGLALLPALGGQTLKLVRRGA